jgi:hypothetical protein
MGNLGAARGPAEGHVNGVASAAASPWPMRLDDFLTGPYLERADVVLTRERGNFFSWLIRWALRSHFAHAAMIYQVPHRSPEYDDVFAIEAGEMGVKIRHFRDYCCRPGAVAAIKRVRRSWLTPERQAKVSAEALNMIEASYDFGRAISLGLRSLRWWVFGLRQMVQGPQKALKHYRKSGYKPPSELICSGLVQFGFIEAISDLVRKKAIEPHTLADVIFVEECARVLPADWSTLSESEQVDMVEQFKSAFKDELESVTPNHLALSPRLDWVFVIRGGLVYPATSQEDAFKLLRWRPRRTPAGERIPRPAKH